jgi:hypothetical protein
MQQLPPSVKICPKCRAHMERQRPCPHCGWRESEPLGIASVFLLVGSIFGMLCPTGWAFIPGFALAVVSLVKHTKNPYWGGLWATWVGLVGNGILFVVFAALALRTFLPR